MICCASSRVGARTKHWVSFLETSMDWSNEIAKMNERWKVEKKFLKSFLKKRLFGTLGVFASFSFFLGISDF